MVLLLLCEHATSLGTVLAYTFRMTILITLFAVAQRAIFLRMSRILAIVASTEKRDVLEWAVEVRGIPLCARRFRIHDGFIPDHQMILGAIALDNVFFRDMFTPSNHWIAPIERDFVHWDMMSPFFSGINHCIYSV